MTPNLLPIVSRQSAPVRPPIAFELMDISDNCIDPTTVLARAAILKAGGSILP